MDPDHHTIRFSFGKYKGEKIFDVYQRQKSYCDFCLSKPDMEYKYPSEIKAIKQLNNLSMNGLSANNLSMNGLSMNNLSMNGLSANNPSMNNQGYKKIEYGMYINFSEGYLRSKMLELNVSLGTIDDILRVMSCNNINASLMEFANLFFYDDIKAYSVLGYNQPSSDVMKICLAWKYGIINDEYEVYGFKSMQSYVVHMLQMGHTMSYVINELTRGKTKDEKKTNILTGRKYCKKLPYLFTPAMLQFILSGVKDQDMKRIYKCCQYDNLMTLLVFPVNRERISELFTLDWKMDYYKFVNNPYAFYRLKSDVCDSVIINTGRNTTNFAAEKYLGSISRSIYDKTKWSKWTATPYWALRNEYPDFINYQGLLRDDYGLVFDRELVYIYHIYQEEVRIAKFITSNITLQVRPFDDSNITYTSEFAPTQEQDSIIRNVLTKSINIVTGLAGSGKSTIIREIVRIVNQQNLKYIVCSFTAKAVKRIQYILKELSYSTIGDETFDHVRTIHSTLNFLKDNIPEYLIIDEASMVSLALLSRLFNLLTNKNVVVIMLGDINQLPPIKYGRPFEDIINSKIVDIHTLTKNLRVKGGVDDPIIVNSTDIVRSNYYSVTPASNFVYINTITSDTIRNIVYSNKITSDTIYQHKFITALNNDNIELNAVLSGLINPSSYSRNIVHKITKKDSRGNKKSIDVNMKYSIGDPVIFTKNGVYKYVKNGCEGIIQGFADGHIIVTSNGNEIRVRLYNTKTANHYYVKHMMLAYCVTVHKSQGSQWPNVYYYVNSYPSSSFNNKRLTYTGTTRSEEKCTVIDISNTYVACCRQDINEHYGGLISRLHDSS